MASHLSLEVGGYRYTLVTEDVLKYPASRLATMVMKCTPDEIIKIDRDGRVFQYVASYLVCGHIPRNENGAIRLDPLTLAFLREEARYFGLNKLFADCDQSCKAQLNSDFHSYVDMHKYIQKVKKDSQQGEGSLKAIYATSFGTTPLLTALGQIWNPFCATGKIFGKHPYSKPPYLREGSTIYDLKLDELIADAQRDPDQSNAYSIPAKGLNPTVLNDVITAQDLAKLTPHQEVTIVCDKLHIHQVGYSQHLRAAMPSAKGEGHIGVLVVILNSTYTGGELEVTHGGRTEAVTGPYKWVAMYGDCLHKINPVTSGTRVSLIYDIYGTQRPLRDLASSEPMELPESPDDVFLAAESAITPPDRAPEEPVVTRIECGATSEDCIALFDALDEELQNRDSIIICLQHLYPECQTSPLFLKGADRALYDLLTNATSNMNDENSGQKYEVQVVAATIYRRFYLQYKKQQPEEHLSGCLFSPSLLAKTLAEKPENTNQDNEDSASETSDEQNDTNVGTNVKDSAKKAIPSCKIVIPNGINADSLLDYSPYIAQTGNESQAGHAVYIVAGLQVRKI